MNKGRITYRFDSDGRRVSEENQSPEQEQQIVTLEEGEAIELPDDKPTAVYEISEPVPVESKDSPQLKRMEVDQNHDSQYLNQFTNDFGAWSSPFDTETEKLEQLIRRSDAESVKKVESKPASYPTADDWPLPPEREENVTYSSMWDEGRAPIQSNSGTLRYIRRSSKSWMKIFTSFTGAIVTGLVLGILVLTFFSGDEEPAGTVPDADVPNNSVDMPPTGQTDENEPPQAGADDGTAPIAVQVPAESFVLLQNGVFTTNEAAEAAAGALRDQGFAAVIVEGEQYYVFAGILNNRDDALALSRVLQTNNFETFIKTIDLAAINELNWGVVDASKIESYFEQSGRLVQMLIDFSAIHLQNGASSPLESASIESVKNVHQTWSAVAHDLAAEAEDEVKAMIEHMNNELNTAVLSLEEYHKSPASSYQWQVQHSVMQFIFQYEQLTMQ